MERVLYAPRALPPLPPDVSQDPGPYAAWARHREEQRLRTGSATRGSNLCLVMAVADAGKIMPPESTWFEPKLADGVVSHVLD